MWKYDDLYIAIEVIKQGSFTAAAKRLGIPTSTLSRRVGELEESLGARLIERTSRKLRPTEKGQLLFQQCSPHMQSLKDSVFELIAKQDDLKGKLKITAPVFLGSEILSDWFSEFARKHEQIDLEIILSNRYEDMLTENIDVAIRIGPLKDSQLIAQFLFTSRFTLCAAKDFIAQLRGPIKTPQDLQQLPLLLLQQHNSQLEFTHKRTGQQMKPLFQPRICSNDIGVIRQAAVDGLGIACLPEVSIRNQTRSGRLATLLSHYEIANARDIYVLYPSKKYLSHKTRIFLDLIKNKVHLISTP